MSFVPVETGCNKFHFYGLDFTVSHSVGKQVFVQLTALNYNWAKAHHEVNANKIPAKPTLDCSKGFVHIRLAELPTGAHSKFNEPISVPFVLTWNTSHVWESVYFNGCAFTLVTVVGVMPPTACSCYRTYFWLKLETDHMSCGDAFYVFIIPLMKCVRCDVLRQDSITPGER